MNGTLVVIIKPAIVFLNLCSQLISLLASVTTTYSTSIDESVTTFYSFEIQLIVFPPIVKTYLVVLPLLCLSPSISESMYPYRTVTGKNDTKSTYTSLMTHKFIISSFPIQEPSEKEKFYS